jgi:hypothetical protein
MRNRVDKLGVSEPNITKQGSDQIVIELPGVKDAEAAARIIGTTAQLELYDLETSLTGPSISIQGQPVETASLYALLAQVQSQVKNGKSDAFYLVNPKTKRVIRRVSLPGCDHDHGLNVDAPRRLAFVACDGNSKLLTLDLRTMKVTGTASIGGSPDVLAFDPGLRRLYVAAETGEVAVFQERGRTLKKLGEDLLAPEAHVVAVDPTTHLVYFPLQSGPTLRIMKPKQ